MNARRPPYVNHLALIILRPGLMLDSAFCVSVLKSRLINIWNLPQSIASFLGPVTLK